MVCITSIRGGVQAWPPGGLRSASCPQGQVSSRWPTEPAGQPRPSGQADRTNDNPRTNDNDRSRGTDLAALGGAQDILIDPTFKEAGMAPTQIPSL